MVEDNTWIEALNTWYNDKSIENIREEQVASRLGNNLATPVPYTTGILP